MAIPEKQLETWSHLGAKDQSANTYMTIRGVLEDSNSPYNQWSYRIFLQGSYGNDTNIYADSDVDIVICLTSIYFPDISLLGDEEKRHYQANRSPGRVSLDDFKADVLAWLKEKLERNVKVGKKALYVPGNQSRRDADVLVCAVNKQFTSYPSTGAPTYIEGICFLTSDGQKIVNYPQQHLDNCAAKNGATASRFKSSIRTLKNIRNAMIRKGYISDALAPSYFLEGMLSNVPDHLFVANRQQTFEGYMSWLESCETNKLTCANGIHQLLSDGVSVSWNKSDFNAFCSAAIEFYDQF